MPHCRRELHRIVFHEAYVSPETGAWETIPSVLSLLRTPQRSTSADGKGGLSACETLTPSGTDTPYH